MIMMLLYTFQTRQRQLFQHKFLIYAAHIRVIATKILKP